VDAPQEEGLQRSLTLRDVVSLGLNGVIGQGIFLLPGLAAAQLGPACLLAVIAAGVLCFLLALCFAEVGSRFQETGGAYVYARAAFGDFVGFEVGWMTCCVAVISWAALANGFTTVLAHLIPAVGEGWVKPAVAVGLISGLSIVNLFGARSGARVVLFFTVAKLIPLVLFICCGLFAMEAGLFSPFAPEGYGPFAETVLLVLYAFVGFETLVVPAGEMDNPQRAVPMALLLVMGIVSIVYVLVLIVSIGTLPELAGHANPVAGAAARTLGGSGALVIAIGICLSVFGTNSGSALVSPRRFFAFAEQGDLPRLFAYTHPKTGAPIPAILLTWILAAGLTLSGTFAELAVLSVLARFMQYVPTCVALLVFRHRDRHTSSATATDTGFRLPGGPVVPLLTIGLCAWLLLHTDPSKLLKGGIALGIGIPLYFISRAAKRRAAERESA